MKIKRFMAVFLVTLGTVLVLILGAELGLRSIFGFGDPLLYLPDAQIGYILAPNQRIKRLGNRIVINQFSMRNERINPERSPQTLRVLLVGDSIVNGGWWTDQRATLSAQIQQQLTDQLASLPFQQVEVLNASANSWGPRNELAYLQHFGNFQAQTIVLVINTDDLFSTQPSSAPVGRDPNYPDHRPPTALNEVIDRYLLRPQPKPLPPQPSQPEADLVGRNLAAIAEIQTIAQAHSSQFFLAMTPLKRELDGQEGPREYERKVRQRLEDWVVQRSIAYLDFLPLFNQYLQERSPESQLYRDHIHLSPLGNSMVSREIAQHLIQQQ
jgi:hypothetical protein